MKENVCDLFLNFYFNPFGETIYIHNKKCNFSEENGKWLRLSMFHWEIDHTRTKVLSSKEGQYEYLRASWNFHTLSHIFWSLRLLKASGILLWGLSYPRPFLWWPPNIPSMTSTRVYLILSWSQHFIWSGNPSHI